MNVTPALLTFKMRFLERFRAFFQHISRRSTEQQTLLVSQPPATEPPAAILSDMRATPCARFLNSDRKYNKPQNRATYKAFEPSFDPGEKAIVLSMYRIDKLEADEIVGLGRAVLGPTGGRLHGHAEITDGEIEALPEQVELVDKFKARFDRDPERHVTVAPWSPDKDIRKLHQMDLARIARLRLLD